jgi:general secretion pathway protein H
MIKTGNREQGTGDRPEAATLDAVVYCPQAPQREQARRRSVGFGGSLPGVTLFEILIAVALIGLLMGGAVMGVQSIGTIALRSSTSKMAALISFMSHEAIIKGRPMRLVIDLGTNTYRAETMARSDDRAVIYLQDVNKREQGANPDQVEEEETKKSTGLGLGDFLQARPPSRPKPAWEPMVVEGMNLEPLDSSVKFAAIYTPQQTQPFTEGQGYLYFWPSGQTEHALIHLSTLDATEEETSKFFSIVVNPTTGRAVVHKERYEFPNDLRDFDEPEESEEEEDDF